MPPVRPNGSNGEKPRGQKCRRTGHNLLLRLQSRKEDVLRFLADLSVPFTNNRAEQDLRMMKVRQKISGCFRTTAGAEDFAAMKEDETLTVAIGKWNTAFPLKSLGCKAGEFIKACSK